MKTFFYIINKNFTFLLKDIKNVNFINIKTKINFSLAGGLLDAEADIRTYLISGVVFFSDIFVGFDMSSFFEDFRRSHTCKQFIKGFSWCLGWFPSDYGAVPASCNSLSLESEFLSLKHCRSWFEIGYAMESDSWIGGR